jgi:hypothetical protein
VERFRGGTGVEDVFGPDDGDGDIALAPLVLPLRLERPELLERDLPCMVKAGDDAAGMWRNMPHTSPLPSASAMRMNSSISPWV